jgi:hypothetical protein
MVLTKQQVMKILHEGVTAFKEVLDNKVYHQGVPVNAQLGNWGGKTLTGCTVCIAGARYLAKNKTLIFEDVDQYQRESGLPRLKAIQRVLGDAEVLLDAMRLPYLSEGSSLQLSGGMKVPGLFRELGIEVPPSSIKTTLNERQVIERIEGILLLNVEPSSPLLTTKG